MALSSRFHNGRRKNAGPGLRSAIANSGEAGADAKIHVLQKAVLSVMGPYADRSLIPFSDLDVNVADRRIKCPWSSVRRGCWNWCSAGPSILLGPFGAGTCEKHHIG